MCFNGIPVINRILSRLLHVQGYSNIYLLLPDTPEDRQIATGDTLLYAPILYGDEYNLVKRYYNIFKHDPTITHVIRVTGDCPFIDPFLISDMVSYIVTSPIIENEPYPWYKHSYELHPYLYNKAIRGLEFECISERALWLEMKYQRDPRKLEHCSIGRRPEYPYAKHNWTLDTRADLIFFSRFYSIIGEPPLRHEDILECLSKDQHLLSLSKDQNRLDAVSQ